jgi:hypothetical protein
MKMSNYDDRYICNYCGTKNLEGDCRFCGAKFYTQGSDRERIEELEKKVEFLMGLTARFPEPEDGIREMNCEEYYKIITGKQTNK